MKVFLFLALLPGVALAQIGGGIEQPITSDNFVGTLSVAKGGTGASDAATARTNLGLNSAATNSANAFQPASSVLTNLSLNNGSSLTNLAISNVVNLQSSLDSKLATNGSAANLTSFPTLNQNTTGTASNVTGVVSITNGGTGTNTQAGARTALGLGSASTNDSSAFQPASSALTNLANNNASALTNFPSIVLQTNTAVTSFPAGLLRTNGSAAGLTSFPTLNQNTTGTASNVTGVVALVNGGTGSTNSAGAATALGLGTTNNVTFSNVTANGNLAVAGTTTLTGAVTAVTNLTVQGTLTVASFATSTPIGWVYDSLQTAANTNGVLTLPGNANVLRVTNSQAIATVTNGALGAVYWVVNQSGTNLVISNTGSIAARGATNLTLANNEAATLIATGATNASIH